ncbi:MAG: glucosaminidase domain-containing protein [Alphaproteobacteria bacterium]|nr:glucosaminidase domain-containing protein [Alphaproteobacteria bacterium]MDP6565173.1 glucosaminidase domain-containing protein [Alphaproteobacteria bacterium]MDP6812306.1 glucosaminidase domain-containing protein [Alphaproteobacteria bacterium]
MKFWNAVLIAAVAVGSCTVAMAGRADVRDREAGFAAFAGFDAWPGVDTAGTNGGGPARLAALLNPPKRRHAWGSNVPGNELLLGLRLAELRRGGVQVPPVYLKRFPSELAKERSVARRKALFIKTVLPLVLRANAEVLALRQQLMPLIARERAGEAFTASERNFLADLAVAYDVDDGDPVKLLLRVDAVPNSLALAQGAEESGWGTSRFAQRGNAVFGQRTFKKGRGLVPRRRDAGKRHEVRAFQDLYTSVKSYLRNLNTHFAYDGFRSVRADLRAKERPLDGFALIDTLDRYSERGEQYIKTIKVIMRANRLADFDRARLSLSLRRD